MSHSPLPWSQSGVQIYDANGQIVIGASYGIDRENDTPLIVRAVNCHDELVAALKAVKEFGIAMPNDNFKDNFAWSVANKMLNEAIAKAEAK